MHRDERLVLLNLELTAELGVVGPVAVHEQVLAGGDGHQVAHDGHEVWVAGCTDSGHGVAIVLGLVNDPLQATAELFHSALLYTD